MTRIDDGIQPDRDDAPFGTTSVSAARRVVWGVIALLSLGATVLLVMRVTRNPVPPDSMVGHDHGAAASGNAAGRPVTLGPRDANRIGITYAVVTREPMVRTVRIVGQVTYDETRTFSVALRVDGYVRRLHANFAGKLVRTGDPLLELYSPMIVTTEQELLVAKRLVAGLAEADPEARARAEALVEAGRQRLAALDVPPAEIRRLEASGESSPTITIEAPAGGSIVEKSVVAGQRIMAGDQLYRIVDLSEVWLEGEIFEQDLPAVHIGQEVIADFPALPGIERRGRVSYISPSLDSETRTARARVVLSNRNLELKPGMFGTIRFGAQTGTAVLSVPRSAVLATGERNLVFVRRADGQFAPREVVLGSATDDRVEILRGLELGETVVASGTFLLDAESNLGTLLGGMGNMPGMDMTTPAAIPSAPRTPDKE
jgi:Cu(I)/Ag(I) efflux system membrane fusion protein